MKKILQCLRKIMVFIMPSRKELYDTLDKYHSTIKSLMDENRRYSEYIKTLEGMIFRHDNNDMYDSY